MIVTGRHRAERRRHRNGTARPSREIKSAAQHGIHFCVPEALSAFTNHSCTGPVAAVREVQVDLLRTCIKLLRGLVAVRLDVAARLIGQGCRDGRAGRIADLWRSLSMALCSAVAPRRVDGREEPLGIPWAQT